MKKILGAFFAIVFLTPVSYAQSPQVVTVLKGFDPVLPFRVEESFNGKPITSPVVTYESVAINGKLDESLFRKLQ